MLSQPTAATYKNARFIEPFATISKYKYLDEAKASTAGERDMPSNPSAISVSKAFVSESAKIIRIQRLNKFELKQPINAVIERDGEGYIVRTIDIPLYGYGEDSIEAINALKNELESLYKDLLEDDNFSGEWLMLKKFLKEQISPIE